MNSREREVRVKQEGNPNYTTKITPSSRSQWSIHKNPRIVRVSRNFGGKDRHSKVCTVRGLRDRRIRLSVPTAIQLYDLQEKLGLSQPSKVVDWLLEASKNDIDKLPPLPSIPGIFTQYHESEPNPNHFLSSNSKKVDDDQRVEIDQEQGNHEGGFGGFVAQLSAHNLFPLGNHHHHHQSNYPNLPNYNNPYFHWDHPNLSLSHFGGAYPLPSQGEEQQNTILSSVVPSSASHLYFCPTAPNVVPPFPPYLAPSMEQNLGFSTALHLMSSSPMRPFAFNVNTKNEGGRSEKEEE